MVVDVPGEDRGSAESLSEDRLRGGLQVDQVDGATGFFGDGFDEFSFGLGIERFFAGYRDIDIAFVGEPSFRRGSQEERNLDRRELHQEFAKSCRRGG